MKYYEFLSEEIYNGLYRDDFLEVLVTARFSKMKELTVGAKKLADLLSVIQSITPQESLDENFVGAVKGVSSIGSLKSGKGISCVFEFADSKYPMVADLNENFFQCEQENFTGQAYMLCKVVSKIPKGQSIKLDEIFDDIKKLPTNREQRRKMPKNISNPDVIRDVIKGPAMIVLPIAVYQ